MPVSLGMDPEFELLNRNYDVVHAASNGFNSLNRKIGCDGVRSTLEFRPSPSEDPKDLIEQLKKMFLKVAEKGFYAGIKGDAYPIGCHIHFSIHNPSMEMIESLDEWLGKPLMHLNGSARKRSSYSNLSAWRSQPHGFEYRSLPSGILCHPNLLEIVLKAAKFVVKNYNTNDDIKQFRYTNWDNWVIELKKLNIITNNEAVEIDSFNTETLSGYARHLITTSNLSNEEIAAKVKEKFSNAKTTPAAISCCRSQIKKKYKTSNVNTNTNTNDFDISQFKPSLDIDAFTRNWEIPNLANMPIFSSSDTWPTWLKNYIRSKSEFSGAHFVGLASSRGDVIFSFVNKALGIPFTMRNPHVSMQERANIKARINELARARQEATNG